MDRMTGGRHGRRPERGGRALFYHRDSAGHSDLAPPQYVAWARREAERLGVAFAGTPEAFQRMIEQDVSVDGDLFLDYGRPGNSLARPGWEAFVEEARRDRGVSHLFIARRDRVARVSNPFEPGGVEHELRQDGLTIVYTDHFLLPIRPGDRGELGEILTSLIDYHQSGKFRLELAQKITLAKVQLANQAFSIGGEPPYGFRRWLCAADGTPVRVLQDREVVKMPGHHVCWLPDEEGPAFGVALRIIRLLPTTLAARVARMLNEEGVPSPKAGRLRRRKGLLVPNSGLWTQNTVKYVAAHPLWMAVCEYGRRASGEEVRLTAEGPRRLTEDDLGPDGTPRTVVPEGGAAIRTPARFDPIITTNEHDNIFAVLEARGRHLKGKARTRKGRANPLGGRVYDLACGWTMYRHERRGRYGYQCGLYQNSQARACKHNVVPGPEAARFVLAGLRQRVLPPEALARLAARLRRLAEAERAEDPGGRLRRELQAQLAQAEARLVTAGRNLALAATPERHQAIASAFDKLQAEKEELVRRLAELPGRPAGLGPEEEVRAALAGLDRLRELVESADPDDPALSELFAQVDAKLYLRFDAVERKGRKCQAPRSGFLAFGPAPPPAPLYRGPTDRALVRRMLDDGEPVVADPGGAAPPGPESPGPEVSWSANVQRGTSRCSGPGRSRPVR
jgi:hypothetical protein